MTTHTHIGIFKCIQCIYLFFKNRPAVVQTVTSSVVQRTTSTLKGQILLHKSSIAHSCCHLHKMDLFLSYKSAFIKWDSVTESHTSSTGPSSRLRGFIKWKSDCHRNIALYWNTLVSNLVFYTQHIGKLTLNVWSTSKAMTKSMHGKKQPSFQKYFLMCRCIVMPTKPSPWRTKYTGVYCGDIPLKAWFAVFVMRNLSWA